MSLELEATVTKLEKIPAYGQEIIGVRIIAELKREDDGEKIATLWIPLLFETGIVPPQIGDTIRVEATWGPIR